MSTPPKSPLERIQNLERVSAASVEALEKKLRETYVPRINTQVREARLRAETLRSKVLY